MSASSGKILISGIILAVFLLAGGTAALAQSAGTYNFQSFLKQSGLNAAADRAGYDVTSSSASVESIISQIIYLGLSFVGIAFFGFLLYGGLLWMTARSNEEKVGQATEIIIACIIGIIITLAAYAITYFLVNSFVAEGTPVPAAPSATAAELI
jgi:hypothetical protein